MFYNLGMCSVVESSNFWRNYSFVYDSSDKSVELVLKNNLALVPNLMYDIGFNEGVDLDLNKLKMLGFKTENRVLRKYLFDYVINNKIFRFCLSIDYICFVQIGSSYIFRQRFNIFGVMVDNVFIFIPKLMVSYLLDLYSRHDFDSIMQSFDNLIGWDFGKFVGDFSLVDNVELFSWC